jgi:septation ring formation regulator EzrA
VILVLIVIIALLVWDGILLRKEYKELEKLAERQNELLSEYIDKTEN